MTMATDSEHSAEPMSGVATLYEKASAIVALCLQHGHRISQGKQDMRSFVDRVVQFQNAVCQLTKSFEDDTKSKNDRLLYFRSSFGRRSPRLSDCLRNLEASLQRLQQALVSHPALQSLQRSLAWPLNANDLRRMDDRMQIVEEGIAKALTTDAAQLPKNVDQYLPRAIALSEELQRMQHEELRQQREIQKDELRRTAILRWLKHPDPTALLNVARNDRNDSIESGSWLVDGPEFQRLQTEKQGMLWLHGEPGTGKTLLNSLVIDHLNKAARKDPSMTVLFWYFSRTDRSRTSAASLLRALISQMISNPVMKIPRTLTDLWVSKLRGRRSPRVAELLAVFLKMAAEVKDENVFIVLDALDECNESERETVFGLLRSMLSDIFEGVHIFATSRFGDEIRVQFLALPRLQSVPIGDRAGPDLIAHTKQTLRTNRVLSKRPPEELQRIEGAILRAAGGNFRLVTALFGEVRACRRASDLDQTLQSLSKNLHEQYDRELSRVKDSESSDLCRLLECVGVARRPLRMAEASEILAVDLDNDSPFFDARNRRFDPSQSLEPCPSIFRSYHLEGQSDKDGSNGEAETLCFANGSVIEYVESQPICVGSRRPQEFNSGSAEIAMAMTCFVYLQHLCTLPSSSLQDTLAKYPFTSYCVEFWSHHYRAASQSQSNLGFSYLKKMVIELFSEQDTLLAYVQLLALIEDESEHAFSGAAEAVKEPLYYATSLGLTDIAEHFLSKGGNLNQVHPSGYGTPLIAAVANGRTDIVRLLLRAGADPTLPTEEYGYPLAVAIEQDEYQMVDLLMHQKGVDIDCQRMPPKMIAERKASAVQRQQGVSDVQATPALAPYSDVNGVSQSVESIDEAKARESMVYVAVEHRAIRTLKLLLDTGADPNIEGGSCHTALILACAQGDNSAVDMLLQHEAQMDIYGGILGSTICAACLNGGNSGLLKKVIDHGVDVNTPLSTGETPLCITAKNNDVEALELLLRHGANPKPGLQTSIAPLEIAARNGYMEIAEKLLNSGADANLPGIEYSTMLHAACISPNIEMLRLLLSRGADVNYIPDNSHATPLQYAASNGKEDAVDLLLGRGANIMAPVGRFGNSMQAAVAGQNLAILEKFRMSGLSVNLRGGPFSYPILRALETLSYDVVEWLLDHGADVSVRNEDGSPYSRYRPTALHMCRDVSLALLLIERGADINVGTAESIPPLMLAAEAGNTPLARFLIDRGANPNGFSPEDRSTPLLSASRGGHADLAELLIQHGADVHHRNACGLNAMTVAVQCRRLELLGVLLLHGAKGPTAVDARGVSDLHYAAASGKLDMIDYIVRSCNQNPSIRDANGWTPLHWATKSPWGGVKMIKKLVSLGVDKNLRDAQGRTALDIAVSLGMKNEADVLRAKTTQIANEICDATDIDQDDAVETWWGFDTCSACGSGRGDQYQCQQCPHYSLCFRCVLDQRIIHLTGHELLCVLHDGDGFDHLQQNRDLDSVTPSNNPVDEVVKSKMAPRLRTSSLRVSDAPLISPSTPLELRWLDQRFRPDSNLSDGRVNSDNFGPPPVPRKDSYLLPSPRVQDLRSSDEPKDLLRVSTGTSQSEYSEASEDGKTQEPKLDSSEIRAQEAAPRIAAYRPTDFGESLEEIDPNVERDISYGPFHLRDDTSPRTTVGHLSALPSARSDVSRAPPFPNSPASLEPMYSPRTIPPTSDASKRADSQAAEDAPIPSHTSFLRPPSLHEGWMSAISDHETKEQSEANDSANTASQESQGMDSARDLPISLSKDSPPQSAAPTIAALPGENQDSAHGNPRELPSGLLTGRPGASKGLQPTISTDESAPAHAWENRRYSRMSIPPPPPPKSGKANVPPAPPTAPAAEGRFPLHMYSVSAGTPAPLYSGNIVAAAGTSTPPSLLPQASTPDLLSQPAASTIPQSLQSATAPPKPSQQTLPPALQPRFSPFVPRPTDPFPQQTSPFTRGSGPTSPHHHGHSASVSQLPGPPDHPSQPRVQMSQQQAMQFLPPRQSSLDKNGQPVAPAPTLAQLKQQEAISFPQQPSRHSIGGLEGYPDYVPASPLSNGPTPLTGPLPPFSASFVPSPLSRPSTSKRGHSPHASESGWRPSPFGETGSYFPPRSVQTSEPSVPPIPPQPSDVSDASYRQRPSDVSNMSFQQRSSEASNPSYQQRPSEASNISYQQRPSEASNASFQPRPSDASNMSFQQRPSEASQVSNMSYQPRPSQGSETHFSPRPSQASESQFAPRPSQGSELHLPHRPSQVSDTQTQRRPPLKPSDNSDSSSSSLGMVALPAEVSLGYGPDFSFDSKGNSKKASNEAKEQFPAKKPQGLREDDRSVLREGQKGRGNAWMADKRAGHMKQNSRQERPADIKTMRRAGSKTKRENPPPEHEPPRKRDSPPLASADPKMMRAYPSALEPTTTPQPVRSANVSGGMAARLTAAAARAGTIANAAAAAAGTRSTNSPDSTHAGSPSMSGKNTPSRPSPPPLGPSHTSSGKMSRNGAPQISASSIGHAGSPFDAGFDHSPMAPTSAGHRHPSDAGIPFGNSTVVTTITGGQQKRGIWSGRGDLGMSSGGSGRGRGDQGKSSPRMHQSPRIRQGSGDGAGKSSPRLQQQPMDPKAVERAKWERGRVDYDRLYGADSDEGY